MGDPNLQDFRRRVTRIERQRALGRGFEAAGALGRRDFRRKPVQKKPVLRAGLFLLAFAFGMKGALHYQMGSALYEQRVAALAMQGGLAQVQAVLMQADPLTVTVSRAIRQVNLAL